MRCLVAPLILVGLCTALLLPTEKGCGEPDVPLHSAYLCQPPLCQGPLENGTFESGAMLEFLCQPGYALVSLPGLAICHRGEWHVLQGGLCKPRGTSVAPHGSSLTLVSSIPLLAGTMVLLAALILALTLCFLVARSVPSPCHCTSQAYESLEDPDFVVEGVDGPGATGAAGAPGLLPSYEEAVFGHMGAPVPPASQGLLTLVVSAQPGCSGHVPGESLEGGDPPPSYQEVMAAPTMATENALDRLMAEKGPMLSAFLQGK